jgi:hypothetical protein
VLDDFVASMDLVARGWRVAFEPGALSTEAPSPSLGAEWERRVRNAAGGWQAVARLRGLWRAGPRTLFQYLSHRVLRWVVTPPLFFALPVLTLALWPRPLYAALLVPQALFGVGAAMGAALEASGRRAGVLAGPLHVVMLNAAAVAGGVRWLRGGATVLWPRVRP